MKILVPPRGVFVPPKGVFANQRFLKVTLSIIDHPDPVFSQHQFTK